MSIFQSGAQFVKVVTFTANVGIRPLHIIMYHKTHFFFIFLINTCCLFLSLFHPILFLCPFTCLFSSHWFFFLHVVCFLHLSVSNHDNTFCQVNPLIVQCLFYNNINLILEHFTSGCNCPSAVKFHIVNFLHASESNG